MKGDEGSTGSKIIDPLQVTRSLGSLATSFYCAHLQGKINFF